jgi:hypothetical protein
MELEAKSNPKKETSESPRLHELQESSPSTTQDEVRTEAGSPSFAGRASDVPATEAQGLSEVGSSPYNDGTNYSSPENATMSYDCDPRYGYTPSTEVAYLGPQSNDSFTSMGAVSDADFAAPLVMPASVDCSLGSNPGGLAAFSHPLYMYSGFPDAVSSSYDATMDGVRTQGFGGFGAEDIQPSVEMGYGQASQGEMGKESPLMTEGFGLQSPPAIDIAGRRKRPGLALSGLRSLSSGSTTGMELGRRAVEAGSPMRRGVPSSGMPPSQRVRRFPSQQRGGILEWRQECLMQAARAPAVPSSLNASAPPTPDTPAVAMQQSVREETASSSSSDEAGSATAYPAADLSGQQATALDQSLRTPPATPVGLGDVLSSSIGATMDYLPMEESFLAPGLEAYTLGHYDVPVPSYVSDGFVSQPTTPQPHPMPGYYVPMHGGPSAAEHAWVTKPSPGAGQQRQIQFSNFTPQDFDAEVKKESHVAS